MILNKAYRNLMKNTNCMRVFPYTFCKFLLQINSKNYSFLKLLCTNNFLKKLLKKAIAICIPIAFYLTLVSYRYIDNYSNAHAKGDLA